jgi:hypothetical protein
MTQEEINKYSVLMAEFMDIEETDIELSKWRLTNSPYSKIFTKSHSKYLDFDKSYDWLMPVWEKFYNESLLIIHNGKGSDWELNQFLSNIQEYLSEPKEDSLQLVFEELGKAIEWYNTIKK